MSQVSPPTSPHSAKSALSLLTLSALGVVYGDIGTSPLYAFKEAFGRAGGLPMNEANVLAILSMMFWSIMVLVSVKYVIVMLTSLAADPLTLLRPGSILGLIHKLTSRKVSNVTISGYQLPRTGINLYNAIIYKRL